MSTGQLAQSMPFPSLTFATFCFSVPLGLTDKESDGTKAKQQLLGTSLSHSEHQQHQTNDQVCHAREPQFSQLSLLCALKADHHFKPQPRGNLFGVVTTVCGPCGNRCESQCSLGHINCKPVGVFSRAQGSASHPHGPLSKIST